MALSLPPPSPPLPPYAPTYYYDSEQDLELYHILLWLVLFGLSIPAFFLLYNVYDMNFNWQRECPDVKPQSNIAPVEGTQVLEEDPSSWTTAAMSSENTSMLNLTIPRL